MDKAYLLFAICTISLLSECKSAAFRSGRYKRNLMKHFMHIYWDPGRLISYFNAVETTREIVNDWRKKVPAFVLMPLLGDKRVKDHFLGPVVGYKKHAPVRRKSYLYPHGTFQRKPLVSNNPDEDTIPLHSEGDSETPRLVVLPAGQFNKGHSSLTSPHQLGTNKVLGVSPAQQMSSQHTQGHPFNQNSGNGEVHILRSYSHSRVPVYSIRQDNDSGDSTAKHFAGMTTAASEHSPGRKILPVPKHLDPASTRSIYHVVKNASKSNSGYGYTSEHVPCLENYYAAEAETLKKPSHLTKMSSIIKILKQKSRNASADRERGNGTDMIPLVRSRQKITLVNSAQTQKQISGTSDLRADGDTAQNTRIYRPIHGSAAPHGNFGHSRQEVNNSAKDDQIISKKLPDFPSQPSQDVKQSSSNKVMLVVIKKKAM